MSLDHSGVQGWNAEYDQTPDSRSRFSLLTAALGTALPAAGLIFVLVAQPQSLWVQSDFGFGGAWLIFAAFLAPATVAAAFGLYAAACHRRNWTLCVSLALSLLALWFTAGPTGSIGWLRILSWVSPALFLVSAVLDQGQRVRTDSQETRRRDL